MDIQHLKRRLAQALGRKWPGLSVDRLQRLTGGASQQMWAFDGLVSGQSIPMILRLNPVAESTQERLPAVAEAKLIRKVGQYDIPAPAIHHVLEPQDGLGSGFVMERLEGEAMPRRILSAPSLEQARSRLARQCGEILARMHKVSTAEIGHMRRLWVADAVQSQLDRYRQLGEPRPVLELTFQWLRHHLPEDPPQLVLVHGDFRNGNLLVDAEGIRGVLDWELAHLGHPLEDFGWLCMNSWRYGHSDLAVGGFGSRDELFAGYLSHPGRLHRQ